MQYAKQLSILPGILLLGIAGVAYYAGMARPIPSGGQPPLSTKTITLGSVSVEAEVADTDAARIAGLSGRPQLGAHRGMLFIFEQEGDWGIWMKDMLFPIDIIWIDSAGMVIGISPDARPETYPKTFHSPSGSARYVLELPAGYASQHGIASGMNISLQQLSTSPL